MAAAKRARRSWTPNPPRVSKPPSKPAPTLPAARRNSLVAVIQTANHALMNMPVAGKSSRSLMHLALLCGLAQPLAAEQFENFTYTDTGTEITIDSFAANDDVGTVTIPESIAGKPVTRIGDGAFAGNPSLTSVTIPAGVTSIGNHAFSGCSGLTSVTISAGVSSIGDDSFIFCDGLTSVTSIG